MKTKKQPEISVAENRTFADLFEAIKADDTAKVKRILKDNPTWIDAWPKGSRFLDGLNPLHYALACGNDKTAQCLVQMGADVNIAMKLWPKSTPIFHQVDSMVFDLKLIEMMLEGGAELNVHNQQNSIPLYLAVKGVWALDESYSTKMVQDRTKRVELLLRYGADPNYTGKSKTRSVSNFIAMLRKDGSINKWLDKLFPEESKKKTKPKS